MVSRGIESGLGPRDSVLDSDLTYSKKGATAAPFFIGGRMAYRFLPPFFFPPLAVFFAITLIPPFTRGFVATGSTAVAAPMPPGTPARVCQRPRFFAKLPRSGR